jgi:ethanolamine utilization protein EutQ (cupin superfamily)
MSDKGMKLEEARVENVLTSKPSASGQQEQYYSYMLRQEKLKNAQALGKINGGEATALKGISDLDQLELKALARLYQLSDNSPELLQYFAITKSGTREEVAKKLAKKQLRKQLVEEAVQKVLPNATVEQAVSTTLTQSRGSRAVNGFGLGQATFVGR